MGNLLNYGAIDLGNFKARALVRAGDGNHKRAAVLTSVWPKQTGLAGMATHGSDQFPHQRLDVTITSKAIADRGITDTATQRYVMGEVLTENQEFAKYQAQNKDIEDKYNNPHAHAVGLTTIALAALEMHPEVPSITIGTLCVSIPVEEAKSEAHLEEVKRRYREPHRIEFHNVPTIGSRSITISFEAVNVVPEGLGAGFALIYQLDGSGLHTADQALHESTWAIGDIGRLTTDIDVFRPGAKNKKATFTPTMSSSVSFGIHDGIEQLLPKIRTAVERETGHGEPFPRSAAHLANLMEEATGPFHQVLAFGKVIDVQKEMDQVFDPLAQTVAGKLLEKWPAEVSFMIIVGGGALALQRYLMKHMQGRDVRFHAEEPMWLNCTGNLYVAYAIAQANRKGS